MNGHEDEENGRSRQEKLRGSSAGKTAPEQVDWKRRVSHFTWSWFACTMSTGAVAVVIGNTPNTFTGLRTIGKVFYILDIVLFLAFCVLMSLRFYLRPVVFTASLHTPPEALFFGAFWVSIALILNGAAIYGVPSSGPWLVTALKICYWLYAGLVLLVAIFQYSTIFVAEKLGSDSASPAWILPIYPFLVLGPLAGTLAKSQPTEAAIPILLGGILFQGLGWMVSIFMYTIYVLRLMSHELPPPPARPGMFIGVGPAGYTSAAFVSLGVQAQKILPDDFMGTSPTAATGDVLKILGVTAGIFLWLLAFWFFALTVWAILLGVREMSFTMTWWAFIFPNGGLTLSAIQIGNALDSDRIRWVTSAMTILLVVLWLFVAVMCIRALWQRKVMWPGMDDDKEHRV